MYERGRNISKPRSPKNIAVELHTLLQNLPCSSKVTLLAHSQGGLYAQQFARMYPDMVSGIVFVDPLSAKDKLEKSREHAEQGKYRDATEISREMRAKYGL